LASALSATPGSAGARPCFQHKIRFLSTDREKAARLLGGLCFLPCVDHPMARGRTYVSQTGEMISRELFATLTRRMRSCCCRPLVRYALNTKVGRPRSTLDHCKIFFCVAEESAWVNGRAVVASAISWPEMASRIKHFAPSAARRFSFHLLGATQRNRLDSLLLCCYPIVVCGRLGDF
jgi:hypothetical protein